jgi:hypothetical protein
MMKLPYLLAVARQSSTIVKGRQLEQMLWSGGSFGSVSLPLSICSAFFFT